MTVYCYIVIVVVYVLYNSHFIKNIMKNNTDKNQITPSVTNWKTLGKAFTVYVI